MKSEDGKTFIFEKGRNKFLLLLVRGRSDIPRKGYKNLLRSLF